MQVHGQIGRISKPAETEVGRKLQKEPGAHLPDLAASLCRGLGKSFALSTSHSEILLRPGIRFGFQALSYTVGGGSNGVLPPDSQTVAARRDFFWLGSCCP